MLELSTHKSGQKVMFGGSFVISSVCCHHFY